ncbi:MAG: transcription-repair coupling factor, partial [Planctomycetota bacterium]
ESFAKIITDVGDVGRGVCFDDVSAAVMNHRELFGHQRTRLTGQRQFESTRPLHSLGELGEMDYVVHADFGIARYLGMEMVEKEGRTDEFLVLEFARKAKVYVPVGRIELVQKYLGTSHENPQLSRLGTGAWEKRKAKALDAAREMAGDLLVLQGKREAAPGVAFPDDTAWQRDFEAAFPWEETPDQLDGMAAIKDDMQRTRPMDRLVCGDVGYGKTELAIRAAFKAAAAGYQVAVLVPTTILAQQHWRTFGQRMAEYPIEVDVLSRFKSRSEQDKLLAGLAEGRVDVVIGTHRLLSQDVHFRNLGLIVVDEEQRFGVKAKEALKRFRATVDILTLTATPIPRTLNMGLLGLRDISSLETPPMDRLSVRTQVTYFDPPLIRQAMMRELNRGGQIFFIHNRVATIGQLGKQIQSIVPEAQLEIAHGQMPAHQLEKIMMRFIEGEFNTLLCTTIVESGLDIPNANTTFVNNAHMFGLSDLHQLRGRVGRYTRRAYAYFLVPRDTVLPEDAVKRLKAIEDFSDLGAGFQIAMRDLEIRGAGNIIGTEQSGHIDAVGYDLYCRLLREAVDNLKGTTTETPPDAHVDLAVRAYIPDDYIARAREKVDLYRRLGQSIDEVSLEEISRELTDRFGQPPHQVGILIEEARLRILASRLGITEIKQTTDRLIIRYTDAEPLEPVLSPAGRLLRIIDAHTVHVMVPDDVTEPTELVAFARKLLQGEVRSD